MYDWLRTFAEIDALDGVALDSGLVGRMSARHGGRPGRIDFFTPTFKSYATSEIAGCGKNLWPAVSITGGNCRHLPLL